MENQIILDFEVDAEFTKVCNNFSYRMRYQEIIDNEDYDPNEPEDPDTNPVRMSNKESKADFVKRHTIDWIKSIALAGEEMKARQAKSVSYDKMKIS